MRIDLGTIEQHVGEKLRRIEDQPDVAERLSALKRFLKIETQRLHLRHRFGIGGGQIVAARSLIVDLVIRRSARAAVTDRLMEELKGRRVGIFALGGYGRCELAPQSDIDILFLHEGRKDAGSSAQLADAMLYLLWDAGFTVGHSVRSLGECVGIAREDIVSRNSLIDARLIWGSEELAGMLGERLEEEVFEKHQRQLLDELMVEREGRLAKFGDAACLQEPNVKESAGGLRDLHVLQWASRIAYGRNTLAGLLETGNISERDGKAISAAYDFLLRVRNELHFLTGRRTDLLSMDLQQQVARNLGYVDSAEQQGSEIFMRDYYLHARKLNRLSETHLRRVMAGRQKRGWLSRVRTAAAIGGFVMRDGLLDLDPMGDGPKVRDMPELDGQQMMLAFGYAQATGAGLSPALQQAIQAGLPKVNRVFRSSPEAAQAFMKMLGMTGRVGAGLRLMHELDFLGKYIPEFGRVTCLVQHDLYHRYTVDEHTLRAIEVLDELAGSRGRTLERYRNLFAGIEDASVLHLALLLHDIGKGLGGGHTEKGLLIAERVCARLQLADSAKDRVLFLIREHLTMSHIAQRRDLADEKVIHDFAVTVETVQNLDLLTILTYADINGVGAGVWNEWKDALLWELHTRTRAYLEPGGERDAEPLRQRIARMLMSEVDYDQVRSHFEQMPEDYVRFTPPQTIIEHIRLANSLKSRPVRTGWRVNTQTRCTDLHLCARNRQGLLAAVAGTLTAQGVNILSVHLNTRTDGLAIDSFKVRDTAGEPISDPVRWEQIDQALAKALSGEVDLEAAVMKRLRAQSGSRLHRRRPHARRTIEIAWDNQSSEKSTILEIQTVDRLGLAFRIASTLSGLDLDIVFAKVATEKNLALDIFYVTGATGEKLTEAELPAIEEAIRRALGEEKPV